MTPAVQLFLAAYKRANVAAAANASQIIAVPSILCRVVITVAGSAAITFYDNAAGDNSGTILAALPATTTVGQVFEFNSPALIGISAGGGANTPGYALMYLQTDR